MDIDSDTWKVIHSYFRDTPDYLVKHHLDSFNDFINGKIPKIFKTFHKKTYFRTDYLDPSLVYETHVYFGGKKGDGIYFDAPTIQDHFTGEKKTMFPNEARLKNLTYGSKCYYDVDIEFTLREKREGVSDKIIYQNIPIPPQSFLKKIYLGIIPIMLRSNLCVLNNTSPQLMQQMGESKYETGGYFIIDGAEKVIVSQERRCENKLFFEIPTQLNFKDKQTHAVEIKSSSSDEFAPARTIRVQMEKEGTITVRLGQNNPFIMPNEGRDVPLFVFFRMLGVISDKEIIEYICHDLNDSLSQKMMNLLRPSAVDSFILEEDIYDQQSATYYMENRSRRAKSTGDFSNIKKSEENRISYLYDTIYEAFLPHVGKNFEEKTHFLAYMTNQLLRFVIGLEKPTERDNFINKRIDLSGHLLSASFRNAVRELVRRVGINISARYEIAHTEYSNQDFVNIINDKNYLEIFDYKKFQKHFIEAMKKGNIDLSLGSKRGAVQSMERKSYAWDLSHLRRIIDPVAGMVTISRRRLHSTQYGCVCPVETPEGQNVGLRKALAMMSTVSFGISPIGVIKLIKKNGLINLQDLHPREMYRQTKVFVNGKWVGIHTDPEKLYTILLLYRRNGLMNIYISVTWYKEKNELIVLTDQGRFVRPLYIVENGDLTLQPGIIEKVQQQKLKWDDLLIGFHKRKKEFNYFDPNMYDHTNLELITHKEDTIEDILKMLHSKQAVIEYLDSEELNSRLLSQHLNLKQPFDIPFQFTHCEIHPSMFLGSSAFLLPFTQHNQAARNSLALAQSKQAIGIFSTNFNQRIDTTSHIIHYPETPLTQTRITKYLNYDTMVTGQNITVAVTVHNGYNQEDAIICNKKSLDMGLFNTTLFKRYMDHEETEEKTDIKSRFYNPYCEAIILEDEVPESIIKSNYNYDKLDDSGFIKEGSIIQEGDVIICKYFKMKDDKGFVIYKDASTIAKKDHYGSVVDKVFCCTTNINKDRLVKIRLAQYRKPIVGDKFASRCGQKGIIGLILSEEDMPYSSNGIIPDMILNPYGYTKRMTIAQFMEILLSKLCVEMGFYGLASPFEQVNPEIIGEALQSIGLDKFCDTTLYDGIQGRMMDVMVFSGPIYYQRLKHMVQDKINARSQGHRVDGIPEPGGGYQVITRQTMSGRAMGGGLRIGEMERDSILAHGSFGFLKESTMERCDKFPVYVSRKTGRICIANPNVEFSHPLYFNPDIDGPMKYYLSETTDDKTLTSKSEILGPDVSNQTDIDLVKCFIPYTMKLLIQELESIGISMKFKIKEESSGLLAGREIDWSDVIQEQSGGGNSENGEEVSSEKYQSDLGEDSDEEEGKEKDEDDDEQDDEENDEENDDEDEEDDEQDEEEDDEEVDEEEKMNQISDKMETGFYDKQMLLNNQNLQGNEMSSMENFDNNKYSNAELDLDLDLDDNEIQNESAFDDNQFDSEDNNEAYMNNESSQQFGGNSQYQLSRQGNELLDNNESQFSNINLNRNVNQNYMMSQSMGNMNRLHQQKMKAQAQQLAIHGGSPQADPNIKVVTIDPNSSNESGGSFGTPYLSGEVPKEFDNLQFDNSSVENESYIQVETENGNENMNQSNIKTVNFNLNDNNYHQ